MIDILDIIDSDAEVDTKVYDSFQDYIQNKAGKNINGLGIIHFNIRSLQKHFNELLVYVDVMKNNLDIIVLSETGEVKDKSNFSIPDYNMYYNESHLNKCDGVVVYVKHSISVIESLVQNPMKKSLCDVSLSQPLLEILHLLGVHWDPLQLVSVEQLAHQLGTDLVFDAKTN
nr:unnamed protein product [Callosobruchus analis]